VTRSPTELSVVCDEAAVPADVRCERSWRALVVQGPLAFDLTGVLASLTGPLAAVGVPIFAISTFDTDWLLVRDAHLERACATLRLAGHEIEPVRAS
jgi:hypothetical protein